MVPTNKRTLSLGGLFAVGVNFLLFALLPQLARMESPRPNDLPRLTVYHFQDVAPEPVSETAPESPPENISPQQPSPQTSAPTQLLEIKTPELQASLPHPPMNNLGLLESIAPTAAPSFFSPEDLDSQPRLSFQRPPIYPRRAKERNITGHVKVEFFVNADGKVSNFRILESVPKGVFDQAVRKAAGKWRFHPGELMGNKVRTRMVKKIVFNLED